MRIFLMLNLERGWVLTVSNIDGGRSVWEPVWRSYMERVQGQKSHPNKSETPVQPRSGTVVFKLFFDRLGLVNA